MRLVALTHMLFSVHQHSIHLMLRWPESRSRMFGQLTSASYVSGISTIALQWCNSLIPTRDSAQPGGRGGVGKLCCEALPLNTNILWLTNGETRLPTNHDILSQSGNIRTFAGLCSSNVQPDGHRGRLVTGTVGAGDGDGPGCASPCIQSAKQVIRCIVVSDFSKQYAVPGSLNLQLVGRDEEYSRCFSNQ